ncbi:hypothetical protein [Nostoc sp. CHAB 5715]|uniref:hypothetical protein n=1 Tax=Nostoc sp. CHAB 5715 TaxID=2780400 RepID=UPI001E53322A|nr:hypothetical protein [Nostoc sp. CHAB 5715]MCC5624450.1 hypothetical protein [Nostoc sp. CHAB 5715]
MIETQLIFRNEYRWDLKKVDSVLIPYLFDNDASLIITIQPKSRLTKNYVTAGKLDQILIDYPNKLVASSQVINLTKNYQVNFPEQGRFQLEFFPYQFLGKTLISISRILNHEN